MSDRGDSTRDWLLKKLLKAKESLVEQAQEIRRAAAERQGYAEQVRRLRSDAQNAADALTRLAERVDDLEFENQQLKRVPPIAPNLQVVYHTQRGTQYNCRVRAVASANGHTRIDVEWAGPRRQSIRTAEDDEFVG